MFKSDLGTYPYVSPIHTYGENLGRATRNFLSALLALEPSELPPHALEDIDRGEDLNALASQFDAIMPNQAAELRYLAGTAEDERSSDWEH